MGLKKRIRANLMKSKFIGDYLMNVMGDKILTNPSKALYSDKKKRGACRKVKKRDAI